MSEADVRNLVTRRLASRDRSRFDLPLEPDGIREDGGWWNVVVRPSRTDVRAHEYADELANLEIKIRDTEHVKVPLVPALAEN